MSSVFIAWVLTFTILSMPAASPGAAGGPYAAEFDQARASTTNSLQLEILADNVITADEYDQSVQAFLGCTNEAGYDVTAEPDSYTPAVFQFTWVYPDATPGVELPQSAWSAYDEAFTTCTVTWAVPVQPLYAATVYFPNNEDVFDANLACLHADGLVPAGFDRLDIERAATTGDWGDGVDAGSTQFNICLMNPFKIGIQPEASPAATP